MSSNITNKRISFASTKNQLKYPDFLEIQLKSFREFFQLNSIPEERKKASSIAISPEPKTISLNENINLCQRGVIYITFACNLKCEFCYYYYINESQGDVDKSKNLNEIIKELDILKSEYNLKYIDITGGEPTTHKDIKEIIKYCKHIDLKPTIITNSQMPFIFPELINCGLDDALISIHGYGSDYDRCVGLDGAYKKLQKTIDAFKQSNFTFRTNTTLLKYNYENLPALADVLIEMRPRITNFIAFNPHEGTAWAKIKDIPCQARYSDIAPYLKKSIDKLINSGIWANIRYFPLCILEGYEKHVCNFHQWQWDPYEWVYCIPPDKKRHVLIKAKKESLFGNTDEDKIHLWIAKHESCGGNIFLDGCKKCKNYLICDGIYPQYYKRFGGNEFKPIKGDTIIDPLFYRKTDLRWNKII